MIKQYPDGFLINGFPFEGGKEHRLPYVAVQLDASDDVSVECQLVEEGDIEVSDSFNPSRSYGKIRIKGVKAIE